MTSKNPRAHNLAEGRSRRSRQMWRLGMSLLFLWTGGCLATLIFVTGAARGEGFFFLFGMGTGNELATMIVVLIGVMLILAAGQGWAMVKEVRAGRRRDSPAQTGDLEERL